MDYVARRSSQRGLLQKILLAVGILTAMDVGVRVLHGSHDLEIFHRSREPEQAIVIPNETAPRRHRPHGGSHGVRLPLELDPSCATVAESGNIAVVVKTGATAVREKLLAQLSTSLRCVRDPLILSDLEQQVGVHEVHDVLSGVLPSAMMFNADFDLYRMQKEYQRLGREADIDELRHLPVVTDHPRAKGRRAAWSLDKYKFLHMIERGWELRSDRDWYVFIDADTYLNWPNLLRWLPQLDPTRLWYVGNALAFQEYPSPLSFAHGGAGIVLSGTTVRSLAVGRKGVANDWDQRMSKMWYGDAALAAALHEELGLDITDSSLSMTENEPRNIAFRAELWCRPVLTLHRCGPQQFQELQEFEEQHPVSNATTFRDLYHYFFPDGLPQSRHNWHNSARDDGILDWTARLDVTPGNEQVFGTQIGPEHEDPHASMEGCRLACIANEDCFQYTFETTISKNLACAHRCHHSRAFRLGSRKRPEVDQLANDDDEVGHSWSSGWMQSRIAKWVEENDCSKGTAWPAVI